MDAPSPAPEISWSGSRFSGNGLRMRFRPSRRIRMFYLVAVPWFDAVLLALCVFFAIHEKGVTPGVRASLPTAPARDGFHADILLVVNPPAARAESDDASRTAPPRAPLVFFDEVRYDMAETSQQTAFAEAIARRLESLSPDSGAKAALFVDRALPYGSLADLLVLLRDSGISQVNFATKTP